MSDAGQAFKRLRTDVGASYDARAMHEDLSEVEGRVERARIGRMVLSSGAVVAVIGVLALVAPRLIGGDETTPAGTPTAVETMGATAEPDDTAGNEVLVPCVAAQVVPGKPYDNPDGEGSLGGFEGWFNGQLTGDGCVSRDSWGEETYLAEAHPDTVWINTIDNTMLEATYRTTIDALGVYGTLSGDFVVPNPDPDWPADRIILIDARTGEVLIVNDPAEIEFE